MTARISKPWNWHDFVYSFDAEGLPIKGKPPLVLLCGCGQETDARVTAQALPRSLRLD